MMDRVPWIIKSRKIEAGGDVMPLPDGDPLDLDMDVDAYIEAQRAAAVVVVHEGKVRLEEYGLGIEPGKSTMKSKRGGLNRTPA